MTAKELKENISLNLLDDSFMVWINEDSSAEFISWQYIYQIAKSKKLSIKVIDKISDIQPAGFLEDKNLYIYCVDKLEEFEPHDHLIILCKKSNYKDAVKIPKIETWQFVDYLKGIVPGMNKSDIEWLLTQYEYTYSRVTAVNYFRLKNDLDKIAIFDESVQNNLFNTLYNSGEYSTVSNLTIFDLSTAIMRKDYALALQVLKVFDYIDSKPDVWLLSILLTNFKNVIDIQLNPKATAESLGMSDKQFYVVKKYNCGFYSQEELIKIYDMLTNMEYLYKFGGLSTSQLTDYMVCKILGE